MKNLSRTFRPAALLFLGSLAIGGVFLKGQGLDPMLGPELARDRGATISSFAWPWCQTLHPGGANDGKMNGGYGFHTQNSSAENPQWWQVELDQVYKIGFIKVYNRMGGCDDCKDRSRNLQVLISKNGTDWSAPLTRDPAEGKTFGGFPNASGSDGPLQAFAGGAEAKFVRLQLNDGNPLHLDEVEVYEYKAPKIIIPVPVPGMHDLPGLPPGAN